MEVPKFAALLRPWGEAGIVHTKQISTGKLEDRGSRMMYVGVSPAHSFDTFLMYNPSTKRVHISRDVQFTKKMFFRQDFSTSTDQYHPLDTSFENLTITVDTDEESSLPAAPELAATDPVLIPDDDDALSPPLEERSVTTTDPTINTLAQSSSDSESVMSIFNADTVFVHPNDPPPLPSVSSPEEEEVPVFVSNHVPEVIEFIQSSESELQLDNESEGNNSSSDSHPFHTVTRRGRKVFKPKRYQQAESNALALYTNPYSIFDLDDELEDDSDYT